MLHRTYRPRHTDLPLSEHIPLRNSPIKTENVRFDRNAVVDFVQIGHLNAARLFFDNGNLINHSALREDLPVYGYGVGLLQTDRSFRNASHIHRADCNPERSRIGLRQRDSIQ